MELEKLIVVVLFFGGAFLLLRPLVQAFAERLRQHGAPAVPGVSEEVLEELQAMRRDMAELAERLDFAERLLAKQRDVARLGVPDAR
ncbi:MAG TPA: hypothetical protein VKO86_11955 [Gemmatimonadales bacterium]|nr:hypothetical protein [Gemmatimonadales bacterium]